MQVLASSSFDDMTDGVRDLEKALVSIAEHWQPHRGALTANLREPAL